MRLISFLRIAVFAALVVASMPRHVRAQQLRIPAVETPLADARRGFVTKIIRRKQTILDPPKPPRGFRLVEYPAPLGNYPAYLTVPETTGKRYPAIIWLIGGFGNSLGSTPWRTASSDNDQSATAFREAGIVTMYLSLRGGNYNAGFMESGYGEVDDVLAAAAFLATQPEVDPARIYLGGHSTGGTLALLVDEMLTSQFRAVFAFGPANTEAAYGKDNIAFDATDTQELYLRSPILYMNTIKTPTFLFEGTVDPSNTQALHSLRQFCKNPNVSFYDLPGVNHFSELAPTTRILAAKIAADTETQVNIAFGDQPLTFVSVLH